MVATLRFASSLLFIITLLAASVSSATLSRSGMILFIGDSNTEWGRITGPLNDTLKARYGKSGFGFIPFSPSFGYVPYRYTIGTDSTWKFNDMIANHTGLTPPFSSPCGFWYQSTTVGAKINVAFPGTGADIYWLARNGGGTFSVAVDAQTPVQVSTAGPTGVRKTILHGWTYALHTIVIQHVSGDVIMLGSDPFDTVAGKQYRAVVHNWGNSESRTSDFIGIDSTIFHTGVQAVNPDVVVILLGTNDYYIDQRTPAEFKANLKRIINRVKTAKPGVNILLVSTFQTKTPLQIALLNQYVATSFPEAASETAISYWDMCTWLGPYSDANMGGDSLHCTAAGGARIANELLNQLVSRFGYGGGTGVAAQAARQTPRVQAHPVARISATGVTIRSPGTGWECDLTGARKTRSRLLSK